MDITQTLQVVGTCASTIGVAWAIFHNISTRKEAARKQVIESLNGKIAVTEERCRERVEGRGMVESLRRECERSQRHNTQQFDAIIEDVDMLKAQHMTEVRVDRKLDPIVKDVAATKENLLALTKKMDDKLGDVQQGMTELLRSASGTEGYLKAMSEFKAKGEFNRD